MPALSDLVPRPPKVSEKETRANAAHLYEIFLEMGTNGGGL